MPKHFRDRVDPWRLLDQDQVIRSSIKLSSMGRLSSVLLDNPGADEAGFSLSFHHDQDKRVVVHCEVSATLDLVCQRCLEPMSMPVETDSRLALVQGEEEAAGLPEELDPLMLADDGLLNIRELVEDELLLAIPDVPRHSEENCALPMDNYQGDAGTEHTQDEPNPFEILAVLKKR